ncbi:MAG: hypothetical protein LBT09_14040 [Planctomycetaceae bacterium]|nr:hypothetical protein [Planctomycetaceae bacterium]
MLRKIIIACVNIRYGCDDQDDYVVELMCVIIFFYNIFIARRKSSSCSLNSRKQFLRYSVCYVFAQKKVGTEIFG